MQPRKAMCSSRVGEKWGEGLLCYKFIDKTKERTIGQVISACRKKWNSGEKCEAIILKEMRRNRKR